MSVRSLVFIAAGVLAVILAGCADPARIAPGSSRADVLARLGPPTARYALPGGGERLQYSRAPAGTEVTDIDTDAAGSVQSVRQVLDEAQFVHDIKPDVWRESDVLATYGRPEEITRVTSFDGTVWSWRYLAHNNHRLLYIYIDPQGVVRRWNTGDDLRYDAPNPSSRS